MKKLLIKFKSFVKNLLKIKTDSHKHWRILLFFFFLMIIILIIFSIYLLFEIKDQQVFQIVPGKKEPPVLINEKLLQKINNDFEIKSLKARDIKDGLRVYEDPSL